MQPDAEGVEGLDAEPAVAGCVGEPDGEAEGEEEDEGQSEDGDAVLHDQRVEKGARQGCARP